MKKIKTAFFLAIYIPTSLSMAFQDFVVLSTPSSDQISQQMTILEQISEIYVRCQIVTGPIDNSKCFGIDQALNIVHNYLLCRAFSCKTWKRGRLNDGIALVYQTGTDPNTTINCRLGYTSVNQRKMMAGGLRFFSDYSYIYYWSRVTSLWDWPQQVPRGTFFHKKQKNSFIARDINILYYSKDRFKSCPQELNLNAVYPDSYPDKYSYSLQESESQQYLRPKSIDQFNYKKQLFLNKQAVSGIRLHTREYTTSIQNSTFISYFTNYFTVEFRETLSKYGLSLFFQIILIFIYKIIQSSQHQPSQKQTNSKGQMRSTLLSLLIVGSLISPITSQGIENRELSGTLSYVISALQGGGGGTYYVDPEPSTITILDSIQICTGWWESSPLLQMVQFTVRDVTGSISTLTLHGTNGGTCTTIYPPANIASIVVGEGSFTSGLQFNYADGTNSGWISSVSSGSVSTVTVTPSGPVTGIAAWSGTFMGTIGFISISSTCTSSDECPPTLPLCSSGTCVACTTSSDCSLHPNQPYCYYGSCVGCVKNSECLGYCHGGWCRCSQNTECVSSYTCYAPNCGYCNSNSECTNPQNPKCSSHFCLPCTASSDCSSQGSNQNCNTTNGTCFTCQGEVATFCQTLKTTTPFCASSGACVSCQAESASACSQLNSSTPYCNSTGNCVQCTTNGDCSTADVCTNYVCVSTSYTPPVIGSYSGTQLEYLYISSSGLYLYEVSYAASKISFFNLTSPTSPQLITSFSTPQASEWKVLESPDGNYVYLPDASGGILVYNFTIKSSPTEITGAASGQVSYLIQQSPNGNTMYYFDESQALFYTMNTDPKNAITVIASASYSYQMLEAVVSTDGNYLWSVDFHNQVLTWSIANSASPSLVGAYQSTTSGSFSNLIASSDNNYLFLASTVSNVGLLILSVASGATPSLVSQYTTSTGTFATIAISSNQNTIYIGDLTNGNGVYIIDVTNRASPSLLSNFKSGITGQTKVQTVSSNGNYLFFYQIISSSNQEYYCLDIQTPASPYIYSSYTPPTGCCFNYQMMLNYEYLIATDITTGLFIMNLVPPCISNSQCSGATPYCKVSNGTCISCQSESSTFCQTNSSLTPICGSSGSCIPCSNNSQCQIVSDLTPFCKANGECTSCQGESATACQSASLTTPYCKSTGVCAACQSGNASFCQTLNSTTPICGGSGACVSCQGEATSACASMNSATPVCNSTGACVECQNDMDCPGTEVCTSNVCVYVPSTVTSQTSTPHSADTWVAQPNPNGTYLFVGASNNNEGLMIYNMENLESLQLISQITSNGITIVNEVQLSSDGNYAYLGTYTVGKLIVVSISNINSPSYVASYQGSIVQVTGMRLSPDGTTIYICDATSSQGLFIIDVTTPSTPTLVTQYTTNAQTFTDVRVSNNSNTAYVIDSSQGLIVLNVATRSSPSQVGSILSLTSPNSLDLSPSGNYILACGTNGIDIISLTTSPISVIQHLSAPNRYVAYSADGDFGFFGGNSGVQTVNLSVPASASIIETKNPATGTSSIQRVRLSPTDGHHLFVSDIVNAEFYVILLQFGVTCVSGTACFVNNYPICTSQFRCIACTSNSECESKTSRLPFCVNSECVQCQTSANCSGTTPICNSSYLCTACTSSSQCSSRNSSYPSCVSGSCYQCEYDANCTSAALPICSSTYSCVGCSSNSECNTKSTSTPTCSNSECYQCISSSNCTNPTPICSSSKLCVACSSNLECSTISGNLNYCSAPNCVACLGSSNCTTATLPICVSNSCIACSSDGQCSSKSAAQPYCVNTECVQCKTIANCTGSTPICSSQYICVACGSNNECSSLTATPYCSTPKCVQCNINSECNGTTPICSNNVCVACTSNSECSAKSILTPTCSQSECLNCSASSNCTGSIPLCISNQCTACTLDTQCEAKDSALYLRCVNSECVGCKTLSDCSGSTPICNSTYFCSACTSNSECSSLTTTPYCSAPKCVQCLSDKNCTGITPICNSNGVCVACTGNSECLAKSPFNQYCVSSQCVNCTADSQCTGLTTPICTGNLCQPCQLDSDCITKNASTLRCWNSECVVCTSNVDCSGSTPICDTTSYTCVGCTTSTQCASFNAEYPFCVSTKCVQCLQATDCPTFFPICVSNACVQCTSNTECSTNYPGHNLCGSGTCGLCVTNSDCPLNLPKCSGVCSPCTQNSDCATHSPYLFCNSTSGQCVTCLTNAECSTPTPYCQTDCVQCRTAADCPSANICNQGACFFHCTQNSDCAPPLTTCNTANGECYGCTKNTDCSNGMTCNIPTGQCYCDSTKFPLGVDQCGTVIYDPSPSVCQNYTINISAPLPSEFTAPLTWTCSIGTNNVLQQMINAYLQGQKELTLILPNYFLSSSYAYTFNVSYIDQFGGSINTSIKMNPVLFSIQFQGPNPFYAIHNEEQFLNFEIPSKVFQCFSMNQFQSQWSQISGPTTLNMNSLVDPNNQLQLIIPACTLQNQATYQVKLVITINNLSYSTPNGNVTQTYTNTEVITLKTNDTNFFTPLFNGNRTQPSTMNLELTGTYSSIKPVCNPSLVTYAWTCTGVTYCTNLVGAPSLSGKLLISSANFAPTNVFYFTLIVTADSVQQSAVGSITIVNYGAGPAYVLSLTCQTECGKYDPSLSTLFHITGNTSAFPNLETNISQGIVPFALFNGQLQTTVKTGASRIAILSAASPNIEAEIKNTNPLVFAYIKVPVSVPPTGGTCSVTPSSGIALQTVYNIATSGWTAQDLPLSYQFSYAFPTDKIFSTLGPAQAAAFINTELPGSLPSVSLEIQTEMWDASGITAIINCSVTVGSPPLTPTQLTAQMNNLVNSLSPTDHSANLQLLALAQRQMNSQLETPSSSPCPLCSGEGTCSNNECVCNSTYKGADCSINQENFEAVMAAKSNLLSASSSQFKQTSGPQATTTLLQTVDAASTNAEFNTQSTMTSVETILNSDLNAKNNPNLTTTQSVVLADTASNMLNFASSPGQGLSTTFAYGLQSEVPGYIDSIETSNLEGKIPGSPPFILSTPNFDVYAAVATPCNLSTMNISTSANSPSVTFDLPANQSLDCAEALNIEYTSFKKLFPVVDPAYSADGTQNKSVVALSITNRETHLPLPFPIKPVLQMPPGVPCPPNCPSTTGNPGENCECPSLNPLAIANQIGGLFGASNLNDLTNISAITSLKFLQNVMFWGIVVYSVWFLITVSLLTFSPKVRKFSIVRHYSLRKNKTLLKALISTFVMILQQAIHPMLSIYVIESDTFKKRSRAIVYYCRIALMMDYNVIFTNVLFSGVILSSENIISQNKGFNPAIIVLPFITYIPLAAIISKLFVLDAKKRKKLGAKIKYIIGLILTVAIFGGSIFMIMVITSQLGSSDQYYLMINFFICITHDMVISPITGTIIKSIMMFMVAKNIIKSKRIIKQLKNAVGDEPVAIFNETFGTPGEAMPESAKGNQPNKINDEERARIEDDKAKIQIPDEEEKIDHDFDPGTPVNEQLMEGTTPINRTFQPNLRKRVTMRMQSLSEIEKDNQVSPEKNLIQEEFKNGEPDSLHFSHDLPSEVSMENIKFPKFQRTSTLKTPK